MALSGVGGGGKREGVTGPELLMAVAGRAVLSATDADVSGNLLPVRLRQPLPALLLAPAMRSLPPLRSQRASLRLWRRSGADGRPLISLIGT